MRNTLERALSRIEDLLSVAEGFRGEEQIVTVKNEDLWRFFISALQTTRAICSEKSPHYAELQECGESFKRGEPFALPKSIGILQAVSDDLKSGMLADMQEIVAAEIFDDLTEMGMYLLEQGYHLPAIAITGAVLEDTLRKVCHKHLVSWEGDSSISKLNTALYKANIYDKAQFGQVDAWGKLRNKVDHGDFKNASEVDRNDAKRMIDGLHDFIVKYLS